MTITRRDSVLLAGMLVVSVALLLLFILLANSYLVYSLPLNFPISMRLFLVDIPNLAFRIFRFDFLFSFLIFALLTIGLGALFPNPILNHFRRFGALVTFAASLAWVEPMIDMSSMLSLQLSARQGAVSASLSHIFAVATHPWIAWTLIPVTFAIYGASVARALQRFARTGERN